MPAISNPVAVIALGCAPDPDIVFGSDRPGAALLEGWSDEGNWRLLLPWPEETRELPWPRAGEWKDLLRELEGDVGDGGESAPLPFLGGWVGFVSYEAMASEEQAVPRQVRPPEPPLFFARHRAGIAVDPRGDAYLFAPEAPAQRYERLLHNMPVVQPAITRLTAPLSDSLGGGEHGRRVESIRNAIRDGDVYQVNLTRSFSASCRCDPAMLYRTLTGSPPPRCSAFLRGDGWAIASASPEVLLRFDRSRGIADSRPIKGTVRRDGSDRHEIESLLRSEKDASEHLMIVDVVRNDLGKIAPAGSVSVPAFRTVRTLEHVHHLESTVRATGLRGLAVADVLAALSPAASITGAPKRAAVQMIREIEPVARGVYCGSIGFIDGRGAEFSVAIRTAIATADSVRYHAGGAIVWDSNAAAEDDECRAKSAAFFRFLGLEA